MKLFIVIGTRENIYQDQIGGPFTSHPEKEIAAIFKTEESAKLFISSNKLKKPIKQSYSDTQYYKTGHLDMDIEEHYLND